MQKSKLFLSLMMMASLLIGIIGIPVAQEARAADGSTGTMSASNDYYYEHSTVSLDMDGLTPSGAYVLNITAGCYPGADSNNLVYFDQGAGDSNRHIGLDDMRGATAGGRTCTIMLCGASTPTVALATVSLTMRKPSEGLPIALIMGIGIPVLIFVVILSLIKRMGN